MIRLNLLNSKFGDDALTIKTPKQETQIRKGERHQNKDKGREWHQERVRTHKKYGYYMKAGSGVISGVIQKRIMYFTVNEKFRKQLWLMLKTRIVNGKRSSETYRNMVEEW